MMVRVAVFVLPPVAAVTVTFVLLLTRCVETVKVAEVEPAAIMTLEGTVAADVLLDRVTVVADVDAAANVTLPVEDEPPVTLVGLSVSELRVAPDEPPPVIVSVALLVTPPAVAEIVAV